MIGATVEGATRLEPRSFCFTAGGSVMAMERTLAPKWNSAEAGLGGGVPQHGPARRTHAAGPHVRRGRVRRAAHEERVTARARETKTPGPRLPALRAPHQQREARDHASEGRDEGRVRREPRPGPRHEQHERSEERRVGKECRSRWSPYH